MKKIPLIAFLVILLCPLLTRAAATFTDSYSNRIHAGGVMIMAPDGVMTPWAPILYVNVSTSLTIDPDAGTARMVGQIAPSSLSTAYTTGVYWDKIGSLPPVFPNPPQDIMAQGFASITVTFNVPATTVDTGVQNFAWDGSAYAIPGHIQQIAASLGITYSVTSDGQTTSSTHNIDLNIWVETGGPMAVHNYPNSASMGFRVLSSIPNFNFAIPELEAPNGFGAEFFIVPETSSALLLGTSALGLLIRRRRSRC